MASAAPVPGRPRPLAEDDDAGRRAANPVVSDPEPEQPQAAQTIAEFKTRMREQDEREAAEQLEADRRAQTQPEQLDDPCVTVALPSPDSLVRPASACAPNTKGAGTEAGSLFVAPGIIEHWNIVDLLPGVPGIQFLIQLSNPGKADQSQGVIAPPEIFLGNPGVFVATTRCAGAS